MTRFQLSLLKVITLLLCSCLQVQQDQQYWLMSPRNPRWRHVYVKIQDGRYFCKIVYVIADPQIYRSFESIKNLQRCDFFKRYLKFQGGMPPPTNSNGGYFCPLPNRSGRYQGTTPTTWLNFYTPCKSQLKNAWPVSPTSSI